VPSLPTGTVTFLFTDIEGSTRLLHELGDSYAGVLAEHRRVLREAFAAHGGVEVDTQGDAFFVAFARASDALAAAGEATDALTGPIRVRVGVHTGEPLVTDEGYVGIDVHRAARIAAAGHGGQVLVSQSTRELAGADGLRDLGEHRLKDLTAPERIWQLRETDFPPLKSLDHTNLPIASSPLVGRGQEVNELVEMLRDGARLVTIIGPGGTGKTRLALQVAGELAGSFDDVWFVPLATLQASEHVAPAIAQTVGAAGDLSDHLRSRRALLVLDNFEHLLDASPTIGELLARADAVRVLATSRAPLRVGVEHEFPLDPLPELEGAALFVERARAAGRRLELDDTVVSVCRRLDGLPLALELAAARTKLLDPAALLARLDQRLPLLTGGRRDAPERQRTLRDTIAWSYGLLDPALQRTFRLLSVFAGFSLDAAEAVCGATIDDVAALVDASLLKSIGADRVLMLETIREYAQERLAESDERDAIRAAHAEYFRDLAQESEPHLVHGGAQQAAWFARLEEERDNLRLAVAFFRENERREDELRLLVATFEFWWTHGYAAEARTYVDHALAAGLPDAPPLAADALEMAAYLPYLEGDHAAVAERAAQMLELGESAGDNVIAARAIHLSALIEPDDEQRATLERRALDLFGDDYRGRHASESLGIIALGRDDLPAARQYLEQTIALCRASGDGKDISTAVILLAFVAVWEGEVNEGEALLLEGVAAAREMGDVSVQVWGRVWPAAAAILHSRGQHERALRLLGAAERLREEDESGELRGFTLRLHDRVKEQVWAAMSEERAVAAWQAGREQASEEFLERELHTLGSE